MIYATVPLAVGRGVSAWLVINYRRDVQSP